jgi:hypothetical protein
MRHTEEVDKSTKDSKKYLKTSVDEMCLIILKQKGYIVINNLDNEDYASIKTEQSGLNITPISID